MNSGVDHLLAAKLAEMKRELRRKERKLQKYNQVLGAKKHVRETLKRHNAASDSQNDSFSDAEKNIVTEAESKISGQEQPTFAMIPPKLFLFLQPHTCKRKNKNPMYYRSLSTRKTNSQDRKKSKKESCTKEDHLEVLFKEADLENLSISFSNERKMAKTVLDSDVMNGGVSSKMYSTSDDNCDSSPVTEVKTKMGSKDSLSFPKNESLVSGSSGTANNELSNNKVTEKICSTEISGSIEFPHIGDKISLSNSCVEPQVSSSENCGPTRDSQAFQQYSTLNGSINNWIENESYNLQSGKKSSILSTLHVNINEVDAQEPNTNSVISIKDNHLQPEERILNFKDSNSQNETESQDLFETQQKTLTRNIEIKRSCVSLSKRWRKTRASQSSSENSGSAASDRGEPKDKILVQNVEQNILKESLTELETPADHNTRQHQTEELMIKEIEQEMMKEFIGDISEQEEEYYKITKEYVREEDSRERRKTDRNSESYSTEHFNTIRQEHADELKLGEHITKVNHEHIDKVRHEEYIDKIKHVRHISKVRQESKDKVIHEENINKVKHTQVQKKLMRSINESENSNEPHTRPSQKLQSNCIVSLNKNSCPKDAHDDLVNSNIVISTHNTYHKTGEKQIKSGSSKISDVINERLSSYIKDSPQELFDPENLQKDKTFSHSHEDEKENATLNSDFQNTLKYEKVGESPCKKETDLQYKSTNKDKTCINFDTKNKPIKCSEAKDVRIHALPLIVEQGRILTTSLVTAPDKDGDKKIILTVQEHGLTLWNVDIKGKYRAREDCLQADLHSSVDEDLNTSSVDLQEEVWTAFSEVSHQVGRAADIRDIVAVGLPSDEETRYVVAISKTTQADVRILCVHVGPDNKWLVVETGLGPSLCNAYKNLTACALGEWSVAMYWTSGDAPTYGCFLVLDLDVTYSRRNKQWALKCHSSPRSLILDEPLDCLIALNQTDPKDVVLYTAGNNLYIYDAVEDIIIQKIHWQATPPSWAIAVEELVFLISMDISVGKIYLTAVNPINGLQETFIETFLDSLRQVHIQRFMFSYSLSHLNSNDIFIVFCQPCFVPGDVQQKTSII
nr:uncharacterized protein LOC128687766 isoform X1 [Cherax quadricarinatus]